MEIEFEHESGVFSLKQVDYEDLGFLMDLRNHPETRKFLGNGKKVSMDNQKNGLVNYKLLMINSTLFFNLKNYIVIKLKKLV